MTGTLVAVLAVAIATGVVGGLLTSPRRRDRHGIWILDDDLSRDEQFLDDLAAAVGRAARRHQGAAAEETPPGEPDDPSGYGWPSERP